VHCEHDKYSNKGITIKYVCLRFLAFSKLYTDVGGNVGPSNSLIYLYLFLCVFVSPLSANYESSLV